MPTGKSYGGQLFSGVGCGVGSGVGSGVGCGVGSGDGCGVGISDVSSSCRAGAASLVDHVVLHSPEGSWMVRV